MFGEAIFGPFFPFLAHFAEKLAILAFRKKVLCILHKIHKVHGWHIYFLAGERLFEKVSFYP